MELLSVSGRNLKYQMLRDRGKSFNPFTEMVSMILPIHNNYFFRAESNNEPPLISNIGR
jgi:hypothetical protein